MSSDPRILHARDLVSRAPATVGPDATTAEIAQAMIRHRTHAVMVIDRGEQLGLVTAFDLLEALAGEPRADEIEHTGYAR